MSISLSTVHIMVDDNDTALGFYRDVLGLSVKYEVENGGFRWTTLTTERQPEVEIVLSQPQPGRSAEDGETLAALLAKGEFSPVQFSADDLAATFDRLLNAPGVEVLQEPTDQPWGARDCAVRDPAGNLIRIKQA